MQQEQWCLAELGGDLAAGRLGRERDDARAVRSQYRADLYRDRASERVTHHDELARPAPTREVGGRGHVVHAAREIVRLAVADAHGADATRRERNAEVVVEPFGRAEQAAHPAAARHEHVVRVDGSVPQQREEPRIV